MLAYTLAAGLPAVVYPLDFDQFDNAARLVRAEVALRARRLEHLAAAVDRGMNDQAISAACRRMQTQVTAGAAEDRIAELVTASFAGRTPITRATTA